MDNQPLVYSNDADRLPLLNRYVVKQFAGRPYGIIWVKDNALVGSKAFTFPANLKLKRVLIVIEGLPVVLDALKTWRQWAVDKLHALDVRVEFVAADTNDGDVEKLLKQWCSKWAEPLVTHEPIGLEVETYIRMGSEKKDKDDPDLLTMMFGSMGELLTRIDLLRNRFSMALAWRTDPKPQYLDAIDKLLASKVRNVRGAKAPVYTATHLKNHIPRLLLRGDTGVGKTLIARYLHNQDSRPPRILIPEYLNKEDMFEYALFGYAQGTYTGGREDGDHGLLLENVGGVVFFDEIGEANDTIQAKLLGYLDDYMIRPRGWNGEPFYCPTLVVAATNRNLKELVNKGKFRADLLRRFTDPELIPPLRDRIESLPFILDCLLQSDAINPAREITELGAEALGALKAHPFHGNFRELEDLLRGACQTAAKNGRWYICLSDLPFQTA